MKRIFLVVIVLALLLTGCMPRYQPEVSREEIVAAYESAGYGVWSDTYDETLDYGEIAYVQANHPDGDYIYFSFFETEEDAKAYKEEFYHPFMMGLFSIIFGEPSWQRWGVYGCIVVQYDDPELLTPFEHLVERKRKGLD